MMCHMNFATCADKRNKKDNNIKQYNKRIVKLRLGLLQERDHKERSACAAEYSSTQPKSKNIQTERDKLMSDKKNYCCLQ